MTHGADEGDVCLMPEGGKEELLSVKGNKERDPETLKAYFFFFFLERKSRGDIRGGGGWRENKARCGGMEKEKG